MLYMIIRLFFISHVDAAAMLHYIKSVRKDTNVQSKSLYCRFFLTNAINLQLTLKYYPV